MQLAARAVLTCPEVSIYPWEIWCKDGAVVPGAAGKRLEHWIGHIPILRMVGFVMCTPCHAFGVVLDIQHKVVEVLDCLPGGWTPDMVSVLQALNRWLPAHDIIVSTKNQYGEHECWDMLCKPRALQGVVTRLQADVAMSQDLMRFADDLLTSVDARLAWEGNILKGSARVHVSCLYSFERPMLLKTELWPKGIAATWAVMDGDFVSIGEELDMAAAAAASTTAQPWPLKREWAFQLAKAAMVLVSLALLALLLRQQIRNI